MKKNESRSKKRVIGRGKHAMRAEEMENEQGKKKARKKNEGLVEKYS